MSVTTPPTKLPLAKPMAAKVDFILSRTQSAGLLFRVFTWTRDPWEQARLWRQSRSTEEIEQAISKLSRSGAPFLADVLKDVGPQYGRWATNNLPGQSWHQYGEAVDLMLISNAGKTVWSGGHPGYEQMARIASQVGLHSGWYWTHRDVNHLQLRPDAVRAYYPWAELNDICQRRYESRDGRPTHQVGGSPYPQAE